MHAIRWVVNILFDVMSWSPCELDHPWFPCEKCCSRPVRQAVCSMRYVVAVFSKPVMVWSCGPNVSPVIITCNLHAPLLVDAAAL